MNWFCEWEQARRPEKSGKTNKSDQPTELETQVKGGVEGVLQPKPTKPQGTNYGGDSAWYEGFKLKN